MRSAMVCLGAWAFLIWLFGIYPTMRKAKAGRATAPPLPSPSEPVPVWIVEKQPGGRPTVRIPGSQLSDGYDLHALNRGEYATTAKQLAQLDHFDPDEWDLKDASALRKQPEA